MRAVTVIGLTIMGLAMLLVAPAVTNGQFGRKGPGGGRFNDPGQMFDIMTGGKGNMAISKLPYGQDVAKQYAKDKGITNGMLTRDQYIEFNQQFTAQRRAGFGGGGFGNKQKGGAGGGFQFNKKGGRNGGFPGGGDSAASQAAPVSPDTVRQLADDSFKKLDANGDGKLNQDEMPRRLKFQLAKWDKNNDGFIDQSEYRDYFAAQLEGVSGNGDETKGVPSVIIEDDELDRKVIVFRLGAKMPAGLPPWFQELDKDPKDGQVALNEWSAAGKDLDEFKTWDLNDDGIITIEEALKVSLAASAATKTAARSAQGASGAFDFSSFFGKGGGNKKGGGGRGAGKGGFGKGAGKGGFGKGGFGKGGFGAQPQYQP